MIQYLIWVLYFFMPKSVILGICKNVNDIWFIDALIAIA